MLMLVRACATKYIRYMCVLPLCVVSCRAPECTIYNLATNVKLMSDLTMYDRMVSTSTYRYTGI